MKLTKSILKQIIKEEINNVLNEVSNLPPRRNTVFAPEEVKHIQWLAEKGNPKANRALKAWCGCKRGQQEHCQTWATYLGQLIPADAVLQYKEPSQRIDPCRR